VAIALSLGIASCGDAPDMNRVIATVNGKPVRYGDLVKELEQQHGPAVLLDMVDETLIRQEAEEQGISISRQEQQGGLDRAAARVGSMADLRTRLRQSGIPMEAYAHKIETNLLLDRIARREIKVTDADIEDYYQKHLSEFQRGPRVRARMMLFLDEGSARAVREILGDPEASFEGLAKTLSEDGATASNGGDMGYFEKDDYAAAITNVAFKLEPDEISAVTKVPDGWVILQGIDSKPAGPMGLDEVKEQIRQRIVRERQEQKRGEWLVGARKAATLIVPDKDLDAKLRTRLDTVKPPPMPGEL